MRETDTGVSRRAVLKRGTIAAGVLGLGGLAGPAAADSTVSGGGDALQSAINDAGDGDTLKVTDSATYDALFCR
ncbi:twin-arginine translocation signal domain-containing protein [Haloarcula sp. JP-L23]|uniref:twin-arginine translocation signal domain-containing protein n=1 Tax=Haloarcula sp. JP-L23 TaxID=2716717 RepID=UPI00140EA4C7|nr:twin-arginine translocation signal domain-containing protein [Haloarcula sp. JP-L23]